MRRRLMIITVASLTLATASTMCQGSKSDARSAIRAAYDRYNTAFKNKDIHTIMALFTADFKWKLVDGKSLDRAKTQAAIEQQMTATVRVHKMSVKIERFTVRGDRAIVYTRELLVATMRGARGKLERLTSEETYRDTWVKTPDGWKFKLAVVLTSKAATKPVRPAEKKESK